MGAKIGFPDEWPDGSGLAVDRGAFVLNWMRANAFNFRRSLVKPGEPVDRKEWWLTPQEDSSGSRCRRHSGAPLLKRAPGRRFDLDSRKAGLPLLMGTTALCLVAVTQCQRSGGARSFSGTLLRIDSADV